ncbi:MAG: S8 family peptidase [Planctomycetota bacterium]|jgi:subtilisin family serine protease
MNKVQRNSGLRDILRPIGIPLVILALGGSALCKEGQVELNDPLFPKQEKLFERINTFEAWELTKGDPNVLIGVIDNGFDFFHPDLRGQLIPGFYAPGGYHTEIYVNNAHGTLISSIIGANENNQIGMAGLAPGCRILASSHGMIEHFVLRLRSEYMKEHPDAGFAEGMKELAKHREETKEFGENWTTYMAESIADAIRYSADHGVRVINISGFLSKSCIPSSDARNKLDKAFAYSADKDVIIVLPSGNTGKEVEDYPGDGRLTIVAGAAMLNDKRWEEEIPMGKQTIKQGSSYGKRLTVMAPVENLVVCLPHEKRFYSADDSPAGATDEEFEDMYDMMPSGATSSAAPIVSSLVALVYSVRPGLDAKSVIEIIKQGCDDIGDKGYDIHTGYGRVNFGKTIRIALAWEK